MTDRDLEAAGGLRTRCTLADAAAPGLAGPSQYHGDFALWVPTAPAQPSADRYALFEATDGQRWATIPETLEAGSARVVCTAISCPACGSSFAIAGRNSRPRWLHSGWNETFFEMPVVSSIQAIVRGAVVTGHAPDGQPVAELRLLGALLLSRRRWLLWGDRSGQPITWELGNLRADEGRHLLIDDGLVAVGELSRGLTVTTSPPLGSSLTRLVRLEQARHSRPAREL